MDSSGAGNVFLLGARPSLFIFPKKPELLVTVEDSVLLTSTFCSSKFSTAMIGSLGEFLPSGDQLSLKTNRD